MNIFKNSFFSLALCTLCVLVFAQRATAQNGQQLYATYCAACHGPDGKGGAAGSIPPLAESEWVKGDARRMISVILHGLAEPVIVKGKTYNLQMPPQGALLDDDKIAKISSYVRQNFGHKEKAVEPSVVKAVREENKDRTAMWTAPELLIKHPLPPLPLHRLGVRNLTVQVYEGTFEQMPDFSKLTPVSEEKEKGPMSLSQAGGRTEDFAIVWEGTIECPATWDANFMVSSVGGMRLFYNNQLVFELQGQGEHYRHTTARVGGTKRGKNTIRLEYFQKGSKGGIALYRSGGSMGYHPLTDTYRDPKAAAFPDIFIGPENGKAAIYRNTMEAVSPRSISIGLEGGINYTYSAATLALEQVWQGKFINAGQHWTNRGTGRTKAAGEKIIPLGRQIGIAKLTDPAAWPKKIEDNWKLRFKGYDLDEKNRPTFRTLIDGHWITDKITEGTSAFTRTISITVPEGRQTDSIAVRLSQKSADASLKIQSTHSARLKQAGDISYLDLSGLSSGTHAFEVNYQWTK